MDSITTKEHFMKNASEWVEYGHIKEGYNYPVGKHRNRIVKKIIKKNQSINSILDIGCGGGNLCIDLAKEGYKVKGIDESGEMIKIANKSIKKLGIGNNVSFGAGTVTGNLRLDEAEILSTVKDEKINTGKTKFGTVVGDNCRIGIHVSINPGIKIGSGTFISSKALVEKDVENNMFAVMKNGLLELKKNTAKLSTSDDREKFKKKV